MSLGENPLAFLRTQPQFLHMRQAIQQNPGLLPALLQQLGRENPQLLQVTNTLKTALPEHKTSDSCSLLLLLIIFIGVLLAALHLDLVSLVKFTQTLGSQHFCTLQMFTTSSSFVPLYPPPANQSASGAVHPDVKRASGRGGRGTRGWRDGGSRGGGRTCQLYPGYTSGEGSHRKGE